MHATLPRLLSRPWTADEKLNLVLQKFILSQGCVASRIQHCEQLQEVFKKMNAKSLNNPVQSDRVRNLCVAKHRFASFSQPLGRTILFLDGILTTAAWLLVNRRNEPDGLAAADFLAHLTEEDVLLAAMCADGADEAVRLLRVFDGADYDLADTCVDLEVFMHRLHYLYNKARISVSVVGFSMLCGVCPSCAWKLKQPPPLRRRGLSSRRPGTPVTA